MDEKSNSSSERTTIMRETMTPDPVFASAPYERIDQFVAPLRVDRNGDGVPVSCRPWEGIAPKKPWEYRIAAGIVHLDQFKMLECVIETLRLQTERPFVHVVDLGSDFETRCKLNRLELSCDDVRIDYIHSRGWSQTSAPVATAMDLIFASVDHGVDYVVSLHVDVFIKSRKYLSYISSMCDEMTPVVGYQMSPRKMTDLWKIIPSHTASCYFMPTMRNIRAVWSMHYAAQRLGISPEVFRNIGGWPDTESSLGMILQDSGIGMRWLDKDGRNNRPMPGESPSWLALGPEENNPYENAWLEHQRSWTSQVLYAPHHANQRKTAMNEALARAEKRIEDWKSGKTY